MVRWERNANNGGYTRTELTEPAKAILAALSTNVSPATMAARTYAYDANGNLLSHSELTNGLHSFAYDALDRLGTDTEPNLPGRSFIYDPNGNRLSQTIDVFSEAYGYLPGSNALSTRGAESYTRDAAGNRLSDQNGARTLLSHLTQ